MQSLSNSVRNRFSSIFGAGLNIPTSLNFDVTNMAIERIRYGPSFRIDTRFGEKQHKLPKNRVRFTNKRDIPVQIVQSLVLKQVNSFLLQSIRKLSFYQFFRIFLCFP